MKLVIRRLPPDLTWESFSSTLPPVDWFAYFGGKPFSKAKQGAYSRVYLSFKSDQDTLSFLSKPLEFYDAQGHHYTPIVELAPFQSIGKKKKPDHRVNTLEQDPDYLEFLAGLDIKTSKPIVTLKPNLVPESTPLMDYLNTKRTRKFESPKKKPIVALVPPTEKPDEKPKKPRKRNKNKNKASASN